MIAPLKKRRGLTLAELLFLVIMIVTIASLVLPGCQRANKLDGRITCKSNLRQIGLATLMHHDTLKRLPRAYGTLNKNTGSVFFHLLPYMEEMTLFQDATPETSFVKLFHCPNDESNTYTHSIDGKVYGLSSYGANYHVFKLDKLNQITRGVTKTIFFTEKLAKCGNGGNAWGWNYTSDFTDGSQWNPLFGFTKMVKGIPPNSDTEIFNTNLPQIQPGTCDPARPSSNHLGFIHAAMGDSSVRYVSPDNYPGIGANWQYSMQPTVKSEVDDNW